MMTQQLIVQGREMRKYSMPATQARRSAGITADYLEAVEAESDYEDDGLTASDRARRSLLSRDRLDEQAEVSTYAACLITCMRVILSHVCGNKQSQDAVQMEYTQESMWPHGWYHSKQHQACFSVMMSLILTDSLCCFLTCLFSMTTSVTFDDETADSALAQLAKTVTM